MGAPPSLLPWVDSQQTGLAVHPAEPASIPTTEIGVLNKCCNERKRLKVRGGWADQVMPTGTLSADIKAETNPGEASVVLEGVLDD